MSFGATITRVRQNRMMLDDVSPEFVSLLDRPSPAVLTTHRKDGSAAVSPVWFRFHQQSLEVVTAEGDVELRHLACMPRCALMIFETEPPFRGLAFEGAPRLETDEGNEVRLDIASRYLGRELGRRFLRSVGLLASFCG